MNKITVIFSSHLSDEENSAFIKHVEETIDSKRQLDVKVMCVVNKAQFSLSEAYNLAWKEVDEQGRGDGILVFCHNDLVFKTNNWGKILLNLFNLNDVDIIGIAGTTELNTHGCWWLTPDGKQMNTSKMFGRVWHTNGVREHETVYSERIIGLQKVVVVDGLFIAVNPELIEHRFDESFNNFHFYDLGFCFPNALNEANIAVTDKISVLHKSVGETDMNWEANRVQFIEKYKEKLPAFIN